MTPRRYWFAVGIMTALVLVPHLSILQLWWLWDDPFHLEYASTWRPADYLFVPASAEALPYRLFTPILTLEYDLDFWLFGYGIRGYHAHQLLILGLTAIALSLALRRWFPPLFSVVVAGVILLGPGTTVWTQELMTRHYATGMLFACVSLILDHRSKSKGSSYSAGSAFFYLLAALSKEIWIPLVPLLILISSGALRQRVARVAPHAIVGAIYVVWRYWMLGTLFGGYGWVIPPEERTRALLFLAPRLFREMALPSLLHLILLMLLAIAAVAVSRTRLQLTLVMIAAIALPLYPVSVQLEDRYLALGWIALLLSGAMAVLRCGPGKVQWVAGLTLAVLAVGAGAVEMRERHVAYVNMSRELRAFVDLPSDAVAVRPLNPFATLDAINRLEARARPDHGAGWIAREVALCSTPLNRRLVRWNGEEFEPWAEGAAAKRALCGQRRTALSMDLHVRGTDDGAIFWRVRPAGGKLSILTGDGANAYEVPFRAGFRIGEGTAVPLRFLLERGDDWYVTPPIGVRATDGYAERFRFEGGSFSVSSDSI